MQAARRVEAEATRRRLFTDRQIGLDVHALLDQGREAIVLADDHDAGRRLADPAHRVGHIEGARIQRYRAAAAASATGAGRPAAGTGRIAARRAAGAAAAAAAIAAGTARRAAIGRRTIAGGAAAGGATDRARATAVLRQAAAATAATGRAGRAGATGTGGAAASRTDA